LLSPDFAGALHLNVVPAFPEIEPPQRRDCAEFRAPGALRVRQQVLLRGPARVLPPAAASSAGPSTAPKPPHCARPGRDLATGIDNGRRGIYARVSANRDANIGTDA